MALSAPSPLALKCSTVPLGALAAMTLTIDFASIHGPSAAGAISTSAANVFASLVNFTEGRAWSPTAWVIRPVPLLSPTSSLPVHSRRRKLVGGRHDFLERSPA